MLAKISLLILCNSAKLASFDLRDPNLAANLYCYLTNWIFVKKYKDVKLNIVKPKADKT